MGRKVLSVAVASTLLWASGANATGMGKLTVLSSLGQPLKAEIELTSPNKDEVSSLAPKLASPEAFRQANIDFNPALLTLRFAVEQRGSSYVIKVSSSQAMNEPFVDLLLEMTSSNGKLLREYTFLLDPAELRSSQSPQIANPAAVNGAAQNKAPEQRYQPAQQPAQPAYQQNVPAKSNANSAPATAGKSASEYKVKTGDTLGKIANQYRSEGLSLDQVLVSLYKSNPQAFIGKNMNRLKSGQILSVLDAQAMRSEAGTATEARGVVIAHAADFNAYRNKLADYVEHSTSQKTASTGQSASGSISTKVKEVPTATSESPDKLKLSKSEAAKAGNGKNAGSEEDKLAKEKAIADANSRVKELEKNVNDLQKLLDVKNKDLAAKESDANKQKADVKVAAASASVPAPAPASASATASSAHEASASAAASASASATSAVVVASASATAPAPASAASVEKPRRKAVPPPPPPPEPSFFDSLPDWLLPGSAVLLAGLAGAGIWSRYRKKKLQHFEDSILTGSSMKANSMFGSTGGQSVDTNNSVFNSNFAPSASQLDANEVDPVAEADVYIAYGRDSQAEEILKEALRTQPERHAVRVKLLEIYFARKDAKQFERLASELYGMTNGSGDEWAQAASMGIALEPNNPLYAGGQVKSEMVNTGFGSATQPLEDLDPDALLANSLSRDMLDAISVIDTAHGPREEPVEIKAEAPAPMVEPEEPAKQDENILDFDLGLGDAAVPKIEEAVAPVAVAEEHVPAMDFGTIDFDFGDHKKEEAAKTEPLIAPEIHEHLDEHIGEHLNELAHADIAHDLSLDIPELNLDMPALHAEAVKPAEHHELTFHENEAPALPEVAKHEEAQPDAASAFEFDLSGIDLDLPSDHTTPATELHHEAHHEAHAHEEPEQPAEHHEHGENAEMATKLDLAVAYHEIGDKEGARELLDEVLRGGTQAQKERAQSMLNQMS